MKHVTLLSSSVFALVALACEHIPVDIGEDLFNGVNNGTSNTTSTASGGNTLLCDTSTASGGATVLCDTSTASGGNTVLCNTSTASSGTTSPSPSCLPTMSLFKCTDGTMLDPNKVCDGSKDCPNGFDELSCSEGLFKCIDGTMLDPNKVCDGTKDCLDGFDKIDCPSIR